MKFHDFIRTISNNNLTWVWVNCTILILFYICCKSEIHQYNINTCLDRNNKSLVQTYNMLIKINNKNSIITYITLKMFMY